MISRVTLGPIVLEGNLEKELFTDKILGYIEKVKVEYSHEHAEEMILTIETSDGENIMTIQGSKDGLWYPRNWNVQDQMYTEANRLADGQSAMNAEKYLSYGKLKINVKGSTERDFIKKLEITIDGQIVAEEEINKEMVSTGTPGVNNAAHRRIKDREKNLMKYLGKVIDKDMAQEISKADSSDLRKFIEDSLYSRKFKGVSKSISEQIKDFILRGVVKQYPKKRTEDYIKRKAGASIFQASLIYRTETHELRNKVREWSYKQLPDYDKRKFVWRSIPDNRRTDICENISRRTANGVSIDKLKQIIKEESDKAKARGELPANFDTREYTPHFECRSAYSQKV